MILAALAAAAAATYTPSAAIELSSYAPGAAPAVTSTSTLHPDQSPTESVAARFPPAFTYNPAFDMPGCAPADEEAWACGEDSRIGRFEASSPLGDGAGPIHLMQDMRIVAFVEAYAGLGRFRINGTFNVLDDGSAEVVFTGLPELPADGGRIVLEGGDRSIMVNPRRCGEYEVRVRFTSHAGEVADIGLPIAITGCRDLPEIRRVRLRGGVLRWRVGEPAVTEVRLLRLAGGEWRELRRWRTRGQRVRVGALRPGRYRVMLRARTADGRVSQARWLSIR